LQLPVITFTYIRYNIANATALQGFGPLSQYLCAKCGSILRETNADIEITTVTEDCPVCGASLSSNLKRQAKNDKTMLSDMPKFQVAYDLVRFKFDIKKIDNFMPLADTGSLCISGYDANLLLTRLCVRALMPANYGGLGSPFVIVVDAGNRSDLYQTVNFVRQYGLRLSHTLDRLIVSRAFTIYQLKSLLSRELPKVIEKYRPNVIVVPGLLDLFEDPNIKKAEAKRVIERILKLISETANKVLVIATINESKFANFVLPSFEKRILLTSDTNSKINAKLYSRGRKANVTLTERELKLVRA
jgi:hypothetical protein